MTVTRAQAIDDLFGLISTALEGQSLDIHWPIEDRPKPSADQSWVRATLQHWDETQSVLGKINGQTKWTCTGKLYAEVYLPVGLSLPTEDDPAMLLRSAFSAGPTVNGVTLRNAGARESGRDGGWNRTVVTVDFEYDEVR